MPPPPASTVSPSSSTPASSSTLPRTGRPWGAEAGHPRHVAQDPRLPPHQECARQAAEVRGRRRQWPEPRRPSLAPGFRSPRPLLRWQLHLSAVRRPRRRGAHPVAVARLRPRRQATQGQEPQGVPPPQGGPSPAPRTGWGSILLLVVTAGGRGRWRQLEPEPRRRLRRWPPHRRPAAQPRSRPGTPGLRAHGGTARSPNWCPAGSPGAPRTPAEHEDNRKQERHPDQAQGRQRRRRQGAEESVERSPGTPGLFLGPKGGPAGGQTAKPNPQDPGDRHQDQNLEGEPHQVLPKGHPGPAHPHSLLSLPKPSLAWARHHPLPRARGLPAERSLVCESAHRGVLWRRNPKSRPARPVGGVDRISPVGTLVLVRSHSNVYARRRTPPRAPKPRQPPA